jgi:hypothetical protein
MFTRLIFRKPFQVARAAMVEIELYLDLEVQPSGKGRGTLIQRRAPRTVPSQRRERQASKG